MKFPPPPNYSDKLDPYGDGWSNIKKTPEKLDEWMRVYYAMTANLDWNVGRLTDALDKAGLKDDTIIVFTSDHGEMFGAHGRMKKNIFYEEAARIPFLISWPKKIPAGLKSNACMNTVDIMPTLLGLMNLPIPQSVEGMNLSRQAMGQKGPEPEAALLMNTGACAIWEDGHEWRALRDKKYTYAIFQDRKKEMLFDNTADPYQMNNLISDSAYAKQAKRFRAMLKAKMAELNDTFPPSIWYQKNWIEDRIIIRTATMD
jgi:arylsulfatase A-like enzyme